MTRQSRESPYAPLHLRVSALSIVLILLLAALLRFHLLGAQSLWSDEGNSYVQATRSFTDIATHAARDIHPPGYYWLLAFWRLLTGETEFALRSLSAFASVLSIAFTYALGKRLFGHVAGLAAALFVTLNTFHIYYAQEARMYALLALWAVASMWAFAAIVRTPNVKWTLALALFNAAGLWTQYAYPFVMLAQGVLVLLWLVAGWRISPSPTLSMLPSIHVRRSITVIPPLYAVGRGLGGGVKKFLILYFAANLLTVLLYLPWLPTAIHQVATWPSTGDGTPLMEALGTTLNWLVFGLTHTGGATGAVVFLFLVWLVQLVKPVPRIRGMAWHTIFPFVWLALPVALFLSLGMFRPGNLKLLLPQQIATSILLGQAVWFSWALLDFPAGRGRFAAVLFTGYLLIYLFFSVFPLYSDPAYHRADYRAIVREVSAELRPGDVIILDAPNQEEVFRYYYRGDAPVYPLPAGLGGNDDETRATLNTLLADYDRAFVVFWGEAERDPQRIVETTLDAETFEVGDHWYGDVRLARYVMPIESFTLHVEPHLQFGEHITLERYAVSHEAAQPGDVVQVRLEWQTDSPLETRYKVFLQLLNAEGVLVAQRDSEPGGGLALTTTWTPGATIVDNHGLRIPPDLPPGQYRLIAGLYDLNDASARLPVGNGDYLVLVTMVVG